jgi:hypothetical protein
MEISGIIYAGIGVAMLGFFGAAWVHFSRPAPVRSRSRSEPALSESKTPTRDQLLVDVSRRAPRM